MPGRRFAALLLLAAALWGAQRGHRRWEIYEREMQNPADDPPDAWVEGEFAFARLRYRSRFDGGWYRARWGIDANKSERQFIQGLRRLTRIHARSVEEIVDIDSDEIFKWPWLYAVGAGDWVFNESQGKRMRRYLQRGGFLMVDDFHNEREWAGFMAGIQMMCPGCPVVEIENEESINHVLYNIGERVRIPGLNVVHGSQIERGGIDPHFRAVLDERGRVVVAICFNMDVGDAWEWADLPEYPEKYASLAYRLGINYVVYSMTH